VIGFQLKYIVWSCTKRCNFYCLHCAKDAGDPLPDELTTQEAKDLLEQIARLGTPLYIAGVEPLLRPDILELTQHCRELGLDVYLKTNGWYLDERVADRLASDNIKIIIGLSGNEELQDRIRGRGSFQRAMTAARLAAARDNLLGISVWLTRLMLHQLTELVDLALGVGAKEFSLADYIPQGKTKEFYKKLMPTPEEYETILHTVYRLYKELEGRITVFPYTIFSRRIMKTKEPQLELSKACSLHDWLEIGEDGKVYSCRSMGLLVGDLRKDSLKDIWERLPESDTGRLIGKLYDRGHIQGKCGLCEYFDICGGCRARAYALTGNMFAADPACPYQPPKRYSSPQ